MNDPNIDPLPPDLAELFAREEGAYPDDAALKRDVLAHVELAATLAGPGGGSHGGAPPGPSPAAPTTPGGAGAAARALIPGSARVLAAAVVSAFAAGGVVGGLIVKASISAPIAASSAIPITTASAAPVDARHDDSDAGIAPIAASAAASIAATPSAAPLASAAAPKARGDLTLEREILDAANAALAHGRPADALALAERHAEQWPRGYLGEEREVVRIQALAASGRRDEAQRRAAQFRASHPKSMLLPAIDAAVPPEK